MSDFFSTVVPWVVAVVTVLSVLACGVVLWVQASKKLKERQFGYAKDFFKMSADFDEPLEDFKDYM